MLSSKKYFFTPVLLLVGNLCPAQENSYPHHTYDSITQVLLSVDKMDQYYRIRLDNLETKQDTAEVKKLYKKMAIADSMNLIIVEDIVTKYGWLGKDKIGSQANTTLLW